MESALAPLLTKLHLFFFLYVLYVGYDGYVLHQEKVKNIQDQIPGLQKKITKQREELAKLKEYYKDIEEAKRRIELVAEQVEKLQQRLPATIDDTQNLDFFSKEADLLNIKDKFLTPAGEKVVTFYFIKSYKFKAKGTFLQFLIFLERIAKVDRLLNISSINIRRAQGEQKGRFRLVEADIDIEAYRYNSAYKEDRGIKEIESKFKGAPKGKKGKRKR